MAFLPVKEYKLTLSGTATQQQLLPVTDESTGNYFQVRLYSPTSDIVCKFGDNTVSASNIYTGNALADGNFTVFYDRVEAFDFKQAQPYLSAIGTGTLYVTVGYNEP